MNANQLRLLIVRPALLAIDMHSDAAENLVMGTAAQESHFKFVQQLGGGPALSMFQMEPATHDDIWDSVLSFRPAIELAVLRAIATDRRPPADRLVWDFRYAAIMCRLHYRRRREPLPDPHDVWAMASYWKRYYNTVAGAGTEQEFVDNYARVFVGERDPN